MFCKDNANRMQTSSLLECYAEMQLILCKDNANERNESLLSNCRVQLILCKDKKIIWKTYLIIMFLVICAMVD